MKLTATTFVSVDGVAQGPGGPEEDRSDGFTRGGWAVPLFDEETGVFVDEVFARVDAFLLGRVTYDIFAGSWPHSTDPTDPTAKALNSLPKYVASTTLRDPQWGPVTVLDNDIPAAVTELKKQPGRELQVHGSLQLLHTLHEHDLIDEYNLVMFPVVVGQGRRLFSDRAIDTALTLIDSRTTKTGVTIASYRPTGRAEFGTMEVE